MQRFYDPVSDKYYEFDPDVKVVEKNGKYTFFTKDDIPIKVAKTLVPAT